MVAACECQAGGSAPLVRQRVVAFDAGEGGALWGEAAGDEQAAVGEEGGAVVAARHGQCGSCLALHRSECIERDGCAADDQDTAVQQQGCGLAGKGIGQEGCPEGDCGEKRSQEQGEGRHLSLQWWWGGVQGSGAG